MNKKTLIIALSSASIIIATISSIVIAKTNKNSENDKIQQVLKTTLGINSPIKINPAPINGLYEVVVDNNIIYTTKDANYVFIGNILDTKNKVNITQKRTDNLQAIKWSDLNLSNAITWQKGNINKNPERQIAIFADPNCGYCKKMEQELQKINNINVYTFILPILSQDSMQKGIDIWCQSKPINAWRDWMLKHKQPPKAMSNCKNPLQANIAFAQKTGISGTPAIIFTDGTRTNGVMEVKEIETKFAQLAKAVKK